MPSQGLTSSSNCPQITSTGCSRRFLPSARERTPERLSNTGVCSEPQALTTARARTVTWCPSAVRASMPVARPPVVVTRSARVCTSTRAPASCASLSHVLSVDCLAPSWQP